MSEYQYYEFLAIDRPLSKDSMLLRLMEGEAPNLRVELLQQFRQSKEPAIGLAPRAGGRTVAELISAAEERTEKRRREKEKRQAEERARLERERAAARTKYLDSLMGREEQLWQQAEALIATKRPLEPERDRVREQWSTWLREGHTVIAPWLWLFETNAVLRRKVTRGELTNTEALEAWQILRNQGIRTVHPRGLFDRAWAMAFEFSRPTTYDATYLAAAELRGCELWTADQRLVNAVAGRFSWLRSL